MPGQQGAGLAQSTRRRSQNAVRKRQRGWVRSRADQRVLATVAGLLATKADGSPKIELVRVEAKPAFVPRFSWVLLYQSLKMIEYKDPPVPPRENLGGPFVPEFEND